jgi:site-specific DNA-methyltransferase (adenine-specific)
MPMPKSRFCPYYLSPDEDVRVYRGNCIDILPKLGMKFDFIFADPPFNIGQDYAGYDDNMEETAYGNFMATWMIYCRDTLKSNGVMALHGPDDLALKYGWVMEYANRSQFKRIAWVNWHYRFGQCGRGNWIDARCHCLIYAKSPFNYTWNPDDVLVDSDRKTTYKDRRIHDTERGGQRLPGTVWGIPSDGPYWGRVQGNNDERRGNHPNQLPEVYLERLIRAYTNPGDTILDPFGGSGTTAVVAAALGRKCITIELSEQSCQSLVERLKKGSVRIPPS